MITTIEVSATAIRLCRVADQRIAALERWPVPIGADPLAALAAAPLPGDLGRVRVLLHHEDLLVRAQIFPACPVDRLDRLVRFDSESNVTEGAEPMSLSWYQAPVGGGGDAPVLIQLVKTRLVDQVRQALVPCGAKLDGLGHPALGLVEAFRAQDGEEAALLLDIGGKYAHLALVQGGALVFQRTITPAIDDLVERLAAKRGLARADAARLIERIGSGSPEDLHELIAATARTIAAQVTAALRFARSQLKLDAFNPTAIHLTGAGAQVHGLAAGLRQGTNLPVRLLNPFAGRPLTVPRADADRLAGLPGEWGVVVGGASADKLILDALGDERQARKQRFATEGVMKLATAAAALLMTSAIALVVVAGKSAQADLDQITKIHPAVTGAAKEVAAARTAKAAAGDKMVWLDGERRTGRIVPELLAAIYGLQDPRTCPIQLSAMRTKHAAGQTVVELEGAALAAGKSGTDQVLHLFEQGLREAYPAIAQLESLPRPIDRDRHPFFYRLTIPDRAAK